MKKLNGFAHSSQGRLSKNIPPVAPSPPAVPPTWFMETLLVVLLSIFGQSVFSQCPIICQNSISTALDNTGIATISADLVLQNSSPDCQNEFTIEVTDTLGNSYGNTVNGSTIGLYLEATATHTNGNACTAVLTVVDNLPPNIMCADTFIYCNVDADPSVIGFPQISDNVSPFDSLTISHSDVFTDLDCYTIQNDSTVTAQIERTWTAMDESGNIATCTQNIWLLRATLSMVEFPDNFDGFDQDPLECGIDDPYDLELTGWPTINNYNLTNATDCELVTTYTDQVNPVCGGEIKIIRTWFVFDICTDNTRVFAQIIKLNDTEAPVITCPANVNYTTYTNSCVAQVYLPQATATDLCSNVTVEPNWTFGTGNGPYNNVPAESYVVTYTATDDCNNQSTCEITVTVEDDDPPTPLCENQIDIVLQSDGTALIYAETFDDGSHDNCGIDNFLVKRDGEPYDEFVYFDCNDIGFQVSVTLKVTDVNGLTNECVSQVSVEDNVAPEILCPPSANLDCGADYNNTGLTGIAFATDNCGIDTVNFNNFINLNLCGIGTITRLWSATDMNGNVVSCTQEISISDNTPLTVTFPDDILTYQCGFITDPTNTGEPILTGQDCEQLGISHTDFTFYTAEPACYKIVRNWAVIDWCTFEPNDPNGEGIWEHTQVIEVLDSDAPVITCPPTTTVEISDNNLCETFAEIEFPTAVDCSQQVTFINNSQYAFNSGQDASGVYPMGEHAITFTAFDGCGNTDDCSMVVVVIDTEPPSPVCNNGVSVTVQQNGLVTITPNLIEGGSTDNCSSYNELIFQISPNTFACTDLGNQTVTLTATDAFGNSSFCQTTVVVQDNLDVCQGNNTVTIAGNLEYEGGAPLSQKLVGLSGGISIAMHTDIDGSFDFQNLPLNNDYTVTPTYDTEYLNGVSTFDLVLIRKHILGADLLDSPYKIIAADANRNGSVSTYDLVEFRKMILLVYPSFPNNTSWRFVDANFNFTDPTNPFLDNFPEEITISNIGTNAWNTDFIGIKVGDVNGSANPANLTGVDDRNITDELKLFINDQELEAGNYYEIPVFVRNFENILGYQFALEFETDILEFSDLSTGDLTNLTEENFGLNLIEEGILLTSWENSTEQNLTEEEALFTLQFYTHKSARLSEILSISADKLNAEAYYGNFTNIQPDDVEFFDISLGFEKTLESDFKLYQNKPNPTSNYTNIGFNTPQAGEVTLKIYTVLGSQIEQLTQNVEAGYHEFDLNLSSKIEQSGVLWYELEMKGFKTQRKKMIVIYE